MDKEKKQILGKKAVALTYEKGDIAPTVSAAGKGYIAQNILEKAKAYNIPTYKDSALVEELTKINIGDNIPADLYQAVAQVLVFINYLDNNAAKTYYEKY